MLLLIFFTTKWTWGFQLRCVLSACKSLVIYLRFHQNENLLKFSRRWRLDDVLTTSHMRRTLAREILLPPVVIVSFRCRCLRSLFLALKRFHRRLIKHNRRHKLKRGPIRSKGQGNQAGSGGMLLRKILKLQVAKDAISCILEDKVLRKMSCLWS